MQQHGRIYLPADRPTSDPGVGVKCQNSSLSEHSHVAYQIKGNHELQQHGSKFFACRPPPLRPQP